MLQSQICDRFGHWQQGVLREQILLQGSVLSWAVITLHSLFQRRKPLLTLPAYKPTVIILSQGQAKDPNHAQRKLLKNPPEKSYGGPVTPQTPADPPSL